MATKTISVDPSFFGNKSSNKKTKKKKKHKLRDNINILQKNFLKEQMIDKIKKFKKKRNSANNKTQKNTNSNDSYKNDYNDAVDFMENIIKKKSRKKKKKRKKDKQHKQQQQQQQQQQQIVPYKPKDKIIPPSIPQNPVQTSKSSKINHAIPAPKSSIIVEPETPKTTTQNSLGTPFNKINNPFIKPDPPYGILKNGNKTLYSKYRKTLKNNNNKPKPYVIIDNDKFGMELDVKAEYERYKKQTTTDVFNEFKSRKDKLLNLQNKTLENNLKLKTTDKKNISFKIKNKKIIKRFKLGKDKKSRKVGVLIKNKKTRRLIDRDIRDLRKKKLNRIKKYLMDHSLIKIGSAAPEKLLRNMYTDCFLSGELDNTGGKNAEEILMHNWNKDK